MTSAAGRKEVDWTSTVDPTVRRPVALVWLVVLGLVFTLLPAIATRIGAPDVPTRLALMQECAVAIGAGLAAPAGTAGAGGPLGAAVGKNRATLSAMNACEERIDDQAPWRPLIGAPVQATLTRLFATGNEQVVVGREGWLFYRPALEHVIGRGFLASRWHQQRIVESDAWAAPPHPDPLPAITAFARALERRGIRLVVLPVPGKATVHPAQLTSRASGLSPAPRNASFPAFVQALRDARVDVLDVAPLLATHARRVARPMYLRTDTHWTPEAVRIVATALAEVIGPHLSPDASHAPWQTRDTSVSSAGDLAALLALPSWTPIPPQQVTLTQVLTADGQPWRPDPTAEVLLLGDSYTNIYSSAGLGWGEGAGLAEHLSLALGRRLDRFVQNDAGAYATREALARAIQRTPERLDVKKVVLYQFAERELSFGDWRPVPMLD